MILSFLGPGFFSRGKTRCFSLREGTVTGFSGKPTEKQLALLLRLELLFLATLSRPQNSWRMGRWYRYTVYPPRERIHIPPGDIRKNVDSNVIFVWDMIVVRRVPTFIIHSTKCWIMLVNILYMDPMGYTLYWKCFIGILITAYYHPSVSR